MNSVVIIINEKSIPISKLPLRKYAEVLSAIEELPKALQLVSGKTQDEILQNLPLLISTCYPDISRLISIVTGLTSTEVDELGLDDFVKIVEAFLSVNNYSYIYDTIKKMGAQKQMGMRDGLS
jgi:hypothetical protein